MNLYKLFQNRCEIIKQNDKGITFKVDHFLSKPEDDYDLDSSEDIEEWILSNSGICNESKKCIKSSFRNDKLVYMGSDALYKCIIEAYATHRPLILSPDVIWLVLCQAFGFHINKNAEKYRHKIVSHEGKKTLVVETSEDLSKQDADWTEVLNGFMGKIAEDSYINSNELVSDFTTTGFNERIASQITVLDMLKPYYEYLGLGMLCGIPEITLEGTPEDWEKLYNKVFLFKGYDLEDWLSKLKPILKEFINASKGKPKASFWKSIVRKWNFRQLRSRSCASFSSPTLLDGWFTTLFPYEKGGIRTDKAYYRDTKMISETVKVNMDFIAINPFTGDEKDYNLELIAGIVGAELNPVNQSLKPKIGWLVREADTPMDRIDYFKEENKSGYIKIRVDKVPEELRALRRINGLEIIFTKHISVPFWMDKIKINYFVVWGEIDEKGKKSLLRRFPDIIIYD